MKWVQYLRMDAMGLVYARVRVSWETAGRPSRVLAAYSGGADSTALLLSLCALREECGVSLRAVHVDHGMRAESARDAAFAQAQCTKVSVPFTLARVTVAPGGSREAAAREARYGALYETLFPEETLALAHHADDQLETALMRLARGGGATGISGMREFDGARRLWRPFLPLSRDVLIAAVRAAGAPYCEDESNHDPAFTRNALRLRVIPSLKAVYPACAEAAARGCALMNDEEDYWRAFADDFLRRYARTRPPCAFLLAEPFDALPVAAQRRVLRAFMPVDLEARHVEEARTAKTANLPGGYRTLRTDERLHLISPDSTTHGGDWALRETPYHGDCGDGLREQAFPRSALEGATIRTRAPGDRIRPFGAAGSQPLKQYCIDRKLDRPFREHMPLLARGSEVLWVIGVGASEAARIGGYGLAAPCSGVKDAVLLKFSGRLPWDLDIAEDKML